MKTEMLTARIDNETKQAFTMICDEIGISASQAIKMFAKAVINHGGIPFNLKVKQPNELSINAMQELVNGKGHEVSSIDELINNLKEDIN
jgi:DNA-damage-inducible protein J